MNIEQILVFDDDFQFLYPFSIMHLGAELLCGAKKIFQRYFIEFPGIPIIFQGEELKLNSFLIREKIINPKVEKKNTLIISSAFLNLHSSINLMNDEYQKAKENKDANSFVFKSNGRPFALYLDKSEIINPSEIDKLFFKKMLFEFNGFFNEINIDNINLINYLWDAIYLNNEALIDDTYYYERNTSLELYKNVFFDAPENIYIGANVTIQPAVYLDASEGQIIIEDNAKIMAQSSIIGPAFIGKSTVIKLSSKIYEKTSIGEHCKVGGEVENSIFQGFANKQHDGFLGHSFLSEWVNLGADTNVSDLKNTYSHVKIQIGNNKFSSGKQFLGVIIGDHSKSAINTMFITGSVVGICSSIVSNDFSQKYTPSFSFGGQTNAPMYDLNKSINVADIVMKRRGKELTEPEIEIIKREFAETKKHC